MCEAHASLVGSFVKMVFTDPSLSSRHSWHSQYMLVRIISPQQSFHNVEFNWFFCVSSRCNRGIPDLFTFEWMEIRRVHIDVPNSLTNFLYVYELHEIFIAVLFCFFTFCAFFSAGLNSFWNFWIHIKTLEVSCGGRSPLAYSPTVSTLGGYGVIFKAPSV